MSQTCYRHPEKEAKRKCFQCKKPICPQCQENLDHHIFCGEECHEKWRKSAEKKSSPKSPESVAALQADVKALIDKLDGVDKRVRAVETDSSEITGRISAIIESAGPPSDDDTLGRLVETLEEIKSRIEGIEASQTTLGKIEDVDRRIKEMEESYTDLTVRTAKEYRPSRDRWGLAIVAGLAVTVVIFSILVLRSVSGNGPENKVAALAGDTVSPPNVVYDDIESAIAPPTVHLAAKNLVLTGGQADISGYAPGASTVTLLLNNREVGDASVVDSGFEFEKIPLDLGINVVQVRSADGAGNQAFSMAWRLERRSKSAAVVRAAKSVNHMRGPANSPWLSLTVDAGASARRAEEVLAALRRENIKTTFFLTGQFIRNNPVIVKTIVADGHEVGNHTYSHPHLTTFNQNRKHYTAPGMSRGRFQDELLRTQKLFEDLTGQKMAPWWRAPYGEHNAEIRGWAAELGFKHVDWTRSPVNHDMLDWVADEKSRYYLDGQALYDRFISIDGGEEGGANGGIILMHLGSDRKKDFVDKVLPSAVERLREKGYSFVTVTQMFGD